MPWSHGLLFATVVLLSVRVAWLEMPPPIIVGGARALLLVTVPFVTPMVPTLRMPPVAFRPLAEFPATVLPVIVSVTPFSIPARAALVPEEALAVALFPVTELPVIVIGPSFRMPPKARPVPTLPSLEFTLHF